MHRLPLSQLPPLPKCWNYEQHSALDLPTSLPQLEQVCSVSWHCIQSTDNHRCAEWNVRQKNNPCWMLQNKLTLGQINGIQKNGLCDWPSSSVAYSNEDIRQRQRWPAYSTYQVSGTMQKSTHLQTKQQQYDNRNPCTISTVLSSARFASLRAVWACNIHGTWTKITTEWLISGCCRRWSCNWRCHSWWCCPRRCWCTPLRLIFCYCHLPPITIRCCDCYSWNVEWT